MRLVAQEIEGPTVAGLARCVKKDVDAAAEALKGAARPRIHVFLATSEIHRKYKLKKAKDEILKAATEMTAYAKGFCEDVEFSPEDASRTEPAFLAEVFDAVVEAGATTVNIPDTVPAWKAISRAFLQLVSAALATRVLPRTARPMPTYPAP